MGMDLYGRKPTGESGRYFRNNWPLWHPLARYCNMIAPETCAPCRHWHSNDGDGLDAAGAVALAEALQKEVDSGRTETCARRYASEQELMPDELCGFCIGTGVQLPFPDRGTGDLKDGGIKCNNCQGTGYGRPLPLFSTENVAAFVAFLRESGGFSIW
jgi:hypothetical protein